MYSMARRPLHTICNGSYKFTRCSNLLPVRVPGLSWTELKVIALAIYSLLILTRMIT